MKGVLTDQPLTELVREVATKGLSGTLRLEHNRAKTAIYFEEGQVIFAASNVRTLRLREYLRKRDLVSEKELATMGDVPDLKLASLLCGIGKLQQDSVDALFATIVSDTLLVALLWTEGNWHFDERAHFNETIRVKVDMPSLLREAAQRMPLKFISLRFLNPKEVITRAQGTPLGNSFTPSEGFLLSRLDVPVKLEELVAISGLRDLEAYRVIYGLALSGHLQREYWHNAFRSAAPKATKLKPETKPALETPEPEPKPPDDREKVEAFLERLSNATDYYEVIELPPTAEANEIKKAYYMLARLYHPDRFHFQSGTPIHARISSAFARITQAYETLTDAKARAAYDASLKRTRKFAEAASKASKKTETEPGTESSAQAGEAEQHFQEGLTAFQEGLVSAAVTHLAIASRMAPDEARYRANYGRALAASAPTRRLAESELLAAVKLEPSSAAYRILLAELYIELKFPRRAQTELERALALDPNNASARALLRKLPGSGKTG